MPRVSGGESALTRGPALQRIVIFDLDVTLTRYDTFLPFVNGYLRFARRRRGLKLWTLPFYLSAFWRWGDRTWFKDCVLRAFMGGQRRARIERWADRYVDYLLEHAMRESGMAELRRHQNEGARVILASASFEIYVEPLARRLGIDEVLASRMAWDHRDRLVGMDGENCRKDEKLRRVRGLVAGAENGHGVTAYSDSSADLPLLAWAENGIAVCPSKRLFHSIGGLGLDVAHW